MSDSETETWIGIAAFAVVAYFTYSYFTQDTETPEEEIEIPAPVFTPPRPTGLQYVATDSTGSVWRLNADTVKGGRSNRQAWLVIDHSKDSSTSAREAKHFYLVDCNTTGTKIPSRTTYGPDGKMIRTDNRDASEMTEQYYPPDTMGYAVVETICSEVYDTPSN